MKWLTSTDWLNVFHSLIIPFLGGFALTLGKLIADHKVLSFDESNDIALDLVLIAVGALGAFHIGGGSLIVTIDAGIGDAFLAMILLYLRTLRKRMGLKNSGHVKPVGAIQGLFQLALGVIAIIWTMKAF